MLPASTNLQEFFTETKVIKSAVFTDCIRQKFTNEILVKINNTCREYTQMIVADQCGLFSRVITDFGLSHIVVDKDGEPVLEAMIETIEAD